MEIGTSDQACRDTGCDETPIMAAISQTHTALSDLTDKVKALENRLSGFRRPHKPQRLDALRQPHTEAGVVKKALQPEMSDFRSRQDSILVRIKGLCNQLDDILNTLDI